jgi:glycosyltransferase involved in cell wall biosynthesis
VFGYDVRVLNDATRRLLASRDNDYRGAGESFRAAFDADEWVPLGGRRPPPGLPAVSLSVVIPAWNAATTIGACLRHLARAAAIDRTSIEVIVVDDGSDDGTWDLLADLDPGLDFLAVRQEHRGRAHAMNLGTALAGGDVVVSCDADMLLLPDALAEMRARHQLMPDALVAGFRSDVEPGHLDRGCAAGSPLPGFAFGGDTRVAFDWPGWPESICLTTGHFTGYGRRRRLWMPSGDTWELARNVFGCLFSVRRTALVEMDGYDEGFDGWGWEDALVGARAIALGAHVVPAYGAAGFHVRHPLRSRLQWEEGRRNRVHFERQLGLPPAGLGTGHLRRAPARVVASRRSRATARTPDGPHAAASPDDDAGWGLYHLHLGEYDAAAARFARASGPDARLGLARALRRAGRADEAVSALRDGQDGAGPAALVELALALARDGRFAHARTAMLRACDLAPRDRLVRFVLGTPRGRLLRRARRHRRQGFPDLAVQDLEAALIQDPSDAAAAAMLGQIAGISS